MAGEKEYLIVQQLQHVTKQDINDYVTLRVKGTEANVKKFVTIYMDGLVTVYSQNGDEIGSEVAMPSKLKTLKVTPYKRYGGGSKLSRGFTLQHVKDGVDWFSTSGVIDTYVKDKFYANPLINKTLCEFASLKS